MEQSMYYVFTQRVTGCTLGRFYQGENLVAKANAHVMPGFPVLIRGCGLMMHSEFDKTLFPGCSREVYLSDNEDAVFATIRYLAEGQHTLETATDVVRIVSDGASYRFFQQDQQVAFMGRPDADQIDYMPIFPEGEFRYYLQLSWSVPEGLLLLMLAFPLLQIAP